MHKSIILWLHVQKFHAFSSKIMQIHQVALLYIRANILHHQQIFQAEVLYSQRIYLQQVNYYFVEKHLFFELLFHLELRKCEIAYFGILDQYIGQKYGGYLLSEALKLGFRKKTKKVWLHTCSLDHKNALKNYLKRGMKIFRSETINLDIS